MRQIYSVFLQFNHIYNDYPIDLFTKKEEIGFVNSTFKLPWSSTKMCFPNHLNSQFTLIEISEFYSSICLFYILDAHLII